MAKRANAVKAIQFSDILTSYDGAIIPASGIKSGSYNGMSTALRVRIKQIMDSELIERKDKLKTQSNTQHNYEDICNKYYRLYNAGKCDYFLYRAIVRILSYKPSAIDHLVWSNQTLTNKQRLRGLLHTALNDYNKSNTKLGRKDLREFYRIAKSNVFVDYSEGVDIEKYWIIEKKLARVA